MLGLISFQDQGDPLGHNRNKFGKSHVFSLMFQVRGLGVSFPNELYAQTIPHRSFCLMSTLSVPATSLFPRIGETFAKR